MSKTTQQPRAARVMRGFVLDQQSLSVRVEFGSTGDLSIRQGQDHVLISANAVEAFKRGMTWVDASVVTSR